MSVVAIIGAQWGDEGKGGIVDLLASQADVVARAQGGSNAGHTVVNELGTFRLHLIPSGIFNPRATCVIGNGVMVDPSQLLAEIDDLEARGVATDRLFISERAHLVMPYHKLLDRLEEEARGALRLGTTGRGIGPAYADKASRVGLRMVDLLDPPSFRAKLCATLKTKNRILVDVYGAEPFDERKLVDEYLTYGERLAGRIADTACIVQDAARSGRNVLLEGAQATLLDTDFGTYPYVTSSSPTVTGVCAGVGLPPRAVDRVIGVFKAYLTRVGEGPFPTELDDEVGEAIRERGGEYGTTTGRPRRCGWFDAVVGRYATRLNGFTSLAVTKLDVLDELPVIRICTAYRCNGTVIQKVPASNTVYSSCEPVYEDHPGWLSPTSEARTFAELPENARRFVERIAELLDLPLGLLSVGKERSQVVQFDPVFSRAD